ncbi:MAG: TolB family protein, partial [Gammaproteobacteria bacterium]
LTFEGSSNRSPLWSPDGSRIAFASNRAGQWNLFVKPVSGGGGGAFDRLWMILLLSLMTGLRLVRGQGPVNRNQPV